MKHELICIVCPEGCHVNIESQANSWNISGNKCVRGQKYAIEEIESPVRTVTAVIKTDSEELPFVSVKTTKPVRKDKINDILQKMKDHRVERPATRGQVVLTNIDGEDTNIVLTRTLR